MAVTSASMWSSRHEIHRLKVAEAGRADLHPVGLVGAVRHEIDAELALGAFGGDIDFARGTWKPSV
jgi:hypothetical protein